MRANFNSLVLILHRTPLVTNNTPETLKTFNSLPSELRSQYDENIYTPSEFALKLLEDPQLVVDAIVRNVTYNYVPMWIFPGIQAGYVLRFVLRVIHLNSSSVDRHMTSIPDGVMEIISFLLRRVFPKPKQEVLKALQG